MQVPVIAFRGAAPEWWIWDTHEATELEEFGSSWNQVAAALRRGTLLVENWPGGFW